MKRLSLACLAICILAAMPVAHAADQPLTPATNNDLLEGLNRPIFDFNFFFDRNVAKPVASTQKLAEMAHNVPHS